MPIVFETLLSATDVEIPILKVMLYNFKFFLNF